MARGVLNWWTCGLTQHMDDLEVDICPSDPQNPCLEIKPWVGLRVASLLRHGTSTTCIPNSVVNVIVDSNDRKRSGADVELVPSVKFTLSSWLDFGYRWLFDVCFWRHMQFNCNLDALHILRKKAGDIEALARARGAERKYPPAKKNPPAKKGTSASARCHSDSPFNNNSHILLSTYLYILWLSLDTETAFLAKLEI